MSAKTATKKKATKQPTEKRMSALDAASKVLVNVGEAMTCGELIEQMAKKGLWESPGGKTPAATLYAGIIKEIQTKGKESRFKKTEPGKFAAKEVSK
jgi:hypothetical protein